MKQIILILIITLISLISSAQITIEKDSAWVKVDRYWETFKTKDVFKGNEVTNDFIQYSIYSHPWLKEARITSEVEQIDSKNYIYKTKRIRAVVFRSRKVEIQRWVEVYKLEEVPLTNDEKVVKYLKKAKERGIVNNNIFWNYPPIDSIINPEKYADTTLIE